MKIISEKDMFRILMRKLNDIAIIMPQKESKKLLKVIEELEDLILYPNDIRSISDRIVDD